MENRLAAGSLEDALRIAVDGAAGSAAVRCVPERFREQVARTPDAVAVAGPEGELTYRELGRQVHRLAHWLRGLGVGPEVPVGVCLEPSPRMVAALLAILEAGGAYLPLDPGHPDERLALLLAEVEPAVVLTEERWVGRFPATARALGLESGLAGRGPLPDDPPPGRAAPENLAYILYTSGSTGRPKGVAICHRSLSRYLSWAEEALLAGIDRLPLVTPLTFDACLKQIFGPLLTGRAVWLLPPEVLAEPRALLAALAAQRRVGLNCVPSLWADLLAEMGPAESSALHGRLTRLFLGGERLGEELVARTLAALPEVRIHNLYGPTEATANASLAVVDSAGEVSLGHPAAGARLCVLGRTLQPVAPGDAGELFLGGPGLARGYLRRPDLTAERFLPDPSAAEPGARLYRTGDRVCSLPDGTLRFLGRVDLQVKIHGVRIEVEEVEAALARLPGVREAAVGLWEAQGGGPRLAAWVVLEEPAPTPGELRELLRCTLPAPMVPARFVRLEALPRTSAGKLDRQALAVPEIADEAEPSAAPRTPTEEILTGIWSRILGGERVGRHDSFFARGGHSLQATRVASAVREVFAVELPLRDLFARPTVAELASFMDEARREGRALVPPIRPVPRDPRLPLSFSQLRQWFLVRMDPETPVYNIPLALRLAGFLEVRALESALGEVLRRHEVLRTTFTTEGGEPHQIVGPPWSVRLPPVDLDGLPLDELDRRMQEFLRMPFDLGGGPLWRAALFRRSDREHVLLLVLHHIVSDGWSLGVLTSELAALYEAAIAGGPPPLPELPVQYADFAAWQRQWLQGEVLERELAHWRFRLAGAPPLLPLPTDRPRPAVQTWRGATEALGLPPGLGRSLQNLASREKGTLFMVLLAAFGILLRRDTGEEDLTVGTFVANRRWKEIEPLVGLFVNTVVLRTDLAGDPGLRELLARLRETTLDAYEHQDLPFEKLLEELEPQRDPSRTPFFQVMLVLQNYPLAPRRLPDLAVEPFDLMGGSSRAHCDLTLWTWEAGEDLDGYLEYNPDLFDRTTILRRIESLRRLLAALADGAGQRISTLPLLSASERQQILAEWSRTGEVGEASPLVHELLALQARQRPETVAVVGERETLTYAELDRRVDRMARRLRRQGVGADTLVGIYSRRSPDAVVGIFGVLRAGGAYLPLDPGLPAERLAFLVNDSGLSVLLAGEALPADLSGLPAQVLPLGGDGGEPAPADRPAPAARALPESGAYLFYTSGSTGLPKGTLIPHGTLATFIETARDLYEIGPQDRVLQFSSLSFDISIEEIFLCLTTGGTLLLRTDDMMASPARFFRGCAGQGVTVLDLPTAWWHELAAELARGEVLLPDSLRLVIIAGERALQGRLDDWQRSVKGRARLLNTYGPTETTVTATFYDPGQPGAPGVTNGVPIGRPLRGVEVYVLDRDLRPVPLGAAGELWIGGVGLGRGYHGRPDRTAERFLPSPFAIRPGERLYRTGDLVRWLSDGNLEFLGRVDDQVKIRGFRVEPGEIAAVLGRYPAVREAVVIPRQDGRDGIRLAAYAAVAAGVTAAELREHLKAGLPAYMIPADFVLLDALPVTPTGKLDRQALPDPAAVREEEEAAEPPETPIEEALVEIWRELLAVERIGIHDSFFDLGGHSLLAPQLLARVEDAFQVELPLRVLFDAPTVARMAVTLEEILLEQIEALSEEEAQSLTTDQRSSEVV